MNDPIRITSGNHATTPNIINQRSSNPKKAAPQPKPSMIAVDGRSTDRIARKKGTGATNARGAHPSGGNAAHMRSELRATRTTGTMAAELRLRPAVPTQVRIDADTIWTMDDLQVAITAARAGADIVKAHFGQPHETRYKGKFDPVTEVDEASEAAILAVLRDARPSDGVMAEESGGTVHSGRHWIVDPLDGTVNFVHGLPHVSVSVALYDGDRGLVGVVYDPLRDELFSAVERGGARLNGHIISVSTVDRLDKAVVGTGFPYDHDVHADPLSVVVREMLREVNGIRRLGSAALDLAWVASGRYDAYWELGIAPWDGAAGIILVREAGGTVTDPFGQPTTPSMGLVVSSNALVHDPFRRIVETWLPSYLVTS